VGRLEIRLLGRPVVLRDGVEVAAPRGAKPWALLAYLVLTERAHSRPELASLLFAEADDPLGALRWNLAQLRRLLGLGDGLQGQDLALNLPDEASVDARLVEVGDPAALQLPELGQDLLDGLSFPDSPGFEAWLLNERARLARRSLSLIRQAALRLVGRGEYDRARRHAIRLVVLDPLDEGHQALLIRTHALAGEADAALQQYQRCRQLLMDELGVEPGRAVVAAAEVAASDDHSPEGPLPPASEVSTRMTVAWETFLAGAADHGIAVGRAALAMADRAGEQELSLTGRLLVGAMLGMTARAWDEASTLLSQASHLAAQSRSDVAGATARGLLAGNELMRGDYEAVVEHAQAGLAQSNDPGTRALNLTFLGAVDADRGNLAPALASGRAAVDCALEADQRVTIVWSATYAARALVLASSLTEAQQMAETAATAATKRMLRPWCLATLSEINTRRGDVDAALDIATEARATAAATTIAWQQAVSHRALALGMAAAGDDQMAIGELIQALRHARREAGEGYAYHWPVALALDALAEITARFDPDQSHQWATALHEHASAIGMAAYTARAHHHLQT
jgi:DNA-binding SARP family transcriptional activator/tetratricopeptide (TPR) repeat protein